jgi:anaerobic selenocysteine-containing dehydrogenase
MRDHRDEIVLRTRALSILAEDGSGTSWDPIKVEGEVAPDEDALLDDDTSDEGLIAVSARVAPDLWQWDGSVPDADVPARDAYALRLVVGRRLYDNGRLVSESPVLTRVRRPFPLHLSPHDAAALGVEQGTEVKVTSTRGSLVVAIEPDAGVPAGVARLDFSADGSGAAELIDAAAAVTDLRVETIR